MSTFPEIVEKETVIALLIFVILAAICFWPILSNPSGMIPGVNGTSDPFDSLWHLWWTDYALFQAHLPLYSTSLLYYPLGTSFITETLQPIAGIITVPLQQISLPLAYNVILISSIALSGLFTYFLALYLTRDRLSSFLAGLIFAFSSVNISHYYIFLDWTTIEFIPLFILFFLLALRTHKHRYVLGASVSFVLVNFIGNVEEGLMVIVFTIALLFFSTFSDSQREILNKKSLATITEISVLSLIIGSPLILPVLQSVVFGHLLSYQYVYQSDGLGNNVIWSNDVASFFLPSQFNGIFNGISSFYKNTLFPYGSAWEGTSYIGYTVMALLFIGVYYGLRKGKFTDLVVWLPLALFFMLLSLGPFIKILGNTTPIPGIYLIYSFIPVLTIIREPGRFGIMASLCIALVSAFGLKYLLIEKTRPRENAKKILIVSIFSILIFVECAGFPVSQQFISNFYLNAAIPSAYSLINESANATAIILPYTYNYTGMAMYYQTDFKIPIFGGFSTRPTLEEELSPYLLPIISMYGAGMPPNNYTFSYPILENYTKLDAEMFSKYNIEYVSIIKSGYNGSALSAINSNLSLLSGKSIYNGDSIELYYIPRINASKSNFNDTAFVSGDWLSSPDYYYLAGLPKNVWWIPYQGNITVYSQNSQIAILCANITSFVNGSLYAYSGGDLLNSTTLHEGNYSYHLALGLEKGYNKFSFLVNSGQTGQNDSYYPPMGFGPITLFYGSSVCPA